MIYYLHALQRTEDSNLLEPIPSETPHLNTWADVQGCRFHPENSLNELVLGGYSYGSLIVARLPSIFNMADRFASAETGSAAAEIVLRARALARRTRHAMDDLHSAAGPQDHRITSEIAARSPRGSGPAAITVGGEDTSSSTTRKRSQESKRSADLVRKSIEIPHRIVTHARNGSSDRSLRKLVPPTTELGTSAVTLRYVC